MHEAFEKIIEQLEEVKTISIDVGFGTTYKTIRKDVAIEIVKQASEEFGTDTNVGSNGWIPVSERLPEVEINPVTNDYVRYNVTYKNGNVSDVRCYAYGEASGGKHWLNGGQIMDEYVIAWHPLPEPYQPKGEGEV